MMFIKKAPNSHGWVNPKDVEDLWRDHFDYFYREYDDFCFPVTIHPDVSGHPHVIFMLERCVDLDRFPFSTFSSIAIWNGFRSEGSANQGVRLIEYISGKEGVQWVTMAEICDDFKKKQAPNKGALMPAEPGAILKDPGKWKRQRSHY